MDAEGLRRLGEDGLAELLRRRPDAADPAPDSLLALANHLQHPNSVVRALQRLDLPTIQVCEALAALGSEPSVKELARLLGVSPRDDDLQRCLSVLRAYGLLDEVAAQRHLSVVTDHGATVGRVRLVTTAALAWESPLDLGPPIGPYLAELTVSALAGILTALGRDRPSRKQDLIDAVVAALTDHDFVRQVVDEADEEVGALLHRISRTGEVVAPPMFAERQTPAQWAQQRGLLIPSDWYYNALVMPAEVMLALRDDEHHAPFQPVPPEVAHEPVDSERVTADAMASVGRLLRVVTASLDQAGVKPIPVLKSGHIGVRELRRIGKEHSADELEVHTALRLAGSLGIASVDERGVSPTADYDAWRAQQPAEQIASLLAIWWEVPVPPSRSIARRPELSVALFRQQLIRSAAPYGRVDLDSVIEHARWSAALAWPADEDGQDGSEHEAAAHACWQEAEFLGVVGAGAVSPIGHALLAGDDLTKVLAGVGETEHSVRLQSDLTAIVGGTPSAALRKLLDLAADPEASGTASTWRFSPASVRRAFDAGYTAEQLLAEIEAVAAGTLPQPLGYLIRDVGRTYGHIRAIKVACCLRSEDTALLAEVAADKRLRKLGLRLLAPTVLASPKPLKDTIAALRAAGFAPVAESADGEPVVERLTTHRSPPRRRVQLKRVDYAAVARQLLAGEDGEPELPQPSPTAEQIAPLVPQLSAPELVTLAFAIDDERPVMIEYRSQSGKRSRRVIEQLDLDGPVLHAWCRLRQDDRAFHLGRILSVSPVSEEEDD
ncbi:helicase-associated domain-containing protein [Fodinicola acaciae]|uniref:helicase-associated domain-containing protein n=1 Tax=Fodinicola acaciae TaxID=2681555 RepID=UPI0013D17F16|nr:helicase-associated domain-containing protein [Fodinicola acaciae]